MRKDMLSCFVKEFESTLHGKSIKVAGVRS